MLLILLLVGALVMIVGLTMAGQTITGIKIGTDAEKQKQAYNAAESGLDFYLQTETTAYNPPGKVKAVISAKPLNVGSGETLVYTGSAAAVDLTSCEATSLQICVKNRSPVRVDYFSSLAITRSTDFYCRNNDQLCPAGSNYLNDDGCFDFGLSGFPRYLAVNLLYPGSTTITVGSFSSCQFGGEKLTATGYADKDNITDVKAIIQAFRSFKIPSFLLEPVVAVEAIIP